MKQYVDKRFSTEFKKSLPKILENKIGKTPMDPSEASFGIAGNTLRAFRGWKKPGETYKSWAKKTTAKIIEEQEIANVSSREGFLKWHKGLRDSLQRHWKKHEGKELQLSHCYKLLDLYIKWLSSHQFENRAFLEGIIRNANCALDSKILERLNQCYSMALPIFKPSMGHIHNQNTYDFCQMLIAEFSASCGGTRLLFDYWTWRPGSYQGNG